MKRKDNKGQTDRNTFLRYLNGEMSDREKNSFEKKLQKDLFASEAADGLDTIEPADRAADLTGLDRRLRRKISSSKRYVYYRIAASVTVLMIISSVFFIVNRKDRQEEPGSIPSSPVVVEIPESKPISEEESTRQQVRVTTSQRSVSEKGGKNAESEPSGQLHAEEASGMNKKAIDQTDISERHVAVRAMEPDKVLIEDKPELQAAPVAAVKEYAEEENIPADPGRKAAKAEAVSAAFRVSDNIVPEPVCGRYDYEKYLRENIRIPEQLPSGDSVTVKISISFSTRGQIKSIRIVDSPGEEFSKEARRLIEEGPRWKPGKSGELQVEDSVELKILFRK
ncbi:MAG: energy transducer TonB [Bacteroidales bacterium]|nr:energy transducer TonB [Bacteroidales bacterium]